MKITAQLLSVPISRLAWSETNRRHSPAAWEALTDDELRTTVRQHVQDTVAMMRGNTDGVRHTPGAGPRPSTNGN